MVFIINFEVITNSAKASPSDFKYHSLILTIIVSDFNLVIKVKVKVPLP